MNIFNNKNNTIFLRWKIISVRGSYFDYAYQMPKRIATPLSVGTAKFKGETSKRITKANFPMRQFI
jgi:hypothetical protein